MTSSPVLDHLRVVETKHLAQYFAEQRDTLEFIAAVHHISPEIPELTQEYAMYHAWLPGFAGVSAADAELVRGRAPNEAQRISEQIAAKGWTEPKAIDLDLLVRKTLVAFPAIQNPIELRMFLERVAAKRPKVAVEIGTAAGGVYYCLSQLLGPDGVLISIDVPFTQQPDGASSLSEVFRSFGPKGQRIELIRDRSFNYSTRQDLIDRLQGRSIDVLLVDGDHAYGAVRSDVEMYAGLVAPGGMIALHDIMMHPETWGRGNDVALYWKEISAGRPAIELIDPQGSRKAPRFDTPVGFEMPALGFGCLEAPL
jgi:predicted O-methyltransferase YrrM